MSDKGLRLFVAMEIPAEIRELVYVALSGLRGEFPGARWVRPENLHITLKFIGEFGEDGLARLSNQLREIGRRCPAFEAEFGTCGAFPNVEKARVIWLGMTQGSEEARAVARKIDARLERVGIERDKRSFRGHVTLARLKKPASCAAALDGLGPLLEELEGRVFEVDEVVLFSSILGEGAPRYKVVERIPLEGRLREKG